MCEALRGRFLIVMLSVLVVSGIAVMHADVPFDQVRHVTTGAALDRWQIINPNVKQETTAYPQIRYKSGDVVTIEAAEGCVQTGGSGDTWKRYAKPQGPNSDRLYHGLIRPPKGSGSAARLTPSPIVPGMVRIGDVLDAQRNGFKFTVMDAKDDSAEPMHLVLGYEDDGYGDNGYWGHDDGTGGQCKGAGNAAVTIRIDHPVALRRKR